MKIYLDNAATSFPKPSSVVDAVVNYMTNIGSNPGRGSYNNALEGSRIVYNCREKLCNLFNFQKPENVIFMPNITYSLNTLIKSIVKNNWHIIISSMEHNSVLRPIFQLKETMNIDIDVIQCSEEGFIDLDDFKSKIKQNTKLAVLSHASNVNGSIQPLYEIGEICRNKGVYFIIDSAQTAGSLEVDFKALNCNALAFTGHKSLLGPQGIGGFLIDDELNNLSIPYIVGGTGSLSSQITQPDFLPDKFESGTLNTPGIAGLLEGIKFIEKEGLKAIRDHEDSLTKYFIDSLLNMEGIIFYGSTNTELRTSTISINFSHRDSAEVSYLLDSQYGIMTRTGLHCAPLAHKTIGSYPMGTLRFSLGYFNTKEEIKYTIDSLHNILRGI